MELVLITISLFSFPFEKSKSFISIIILYSIFVLFFFSLFRDNFILLQAAIASMGYYVFPSSERLPQWNTKGFIAVLILHVAVSEPLYYVLHRQFHKNQYLFTHYHSLHHSSPVPQIPTGTIIYNFVIYFILNKLIVSDQFFYMD